MTSQKLVRKELGFNKICFPSTRCKTASPRFCKLDVVNYIHMEEAYGQFKNHIQKYSLTNGQPLKLARKRLKLTIKIEDFAVYPRYLMTE